MSAPSLALAQASATSSSIRFARSGGVKTSSLDRLAIHVNTSGFRFRRFRRAVSSIGDLINCHRWVLPRRSKDLVTVESGKQCPVVKTRHLGKAVITEVASLIEAFPEVCPFGEGDWVSRFDRA